MRATDDEPAPSTTGGIYWLASYPKSGNTWFRAFLKNLREDGDEPCNINQLTTGAIASDRTWLSDVLGFDTAELTHDEIEALRPEVYRWSLRSPEIGYHKIHDAYLPLATSQPLVGVENTLGALYIVRNPLDVVSSAANHWNLDIDRTIDRMADPQMTLAARRNGLVSQVRQRLLSWSGHVRSWVDATDLNCHVIRYEDMLADPVTTFSSAANFLELPCDPARIEKAIRFSAFDELSRQEALNGFQERPRRAMRFFREGNSGGWRQALSPAQIDRIAADHRDIMMRFGYLDSEGSPV